MGNLMARCVHGAEIQDRDGADLVLELLRGHFPRLRKLWADGGYTGDLVAWTERELGVTLEIVKKPADQLGFAVQPKRWIVEQTFGCFGRYRRLAKDYEHHTDHAEAMIDLAMTHRMLRRLSKAA